MYNRILKRLIDILGSVMIMILFSPIVFMISIILFLTFQESPLFIQLRPGKNGIPFKLIKFKTMTTIHDEKGTLLPDEERLTKIGKVIRKTSLDEIPQFINVLIGDMSLVGSRPLLVDYLHLYNDYQARRHEVLPGITGWAQVNGRNAISWDEKLGLDVWYVDNLSFKLDFRILLLTLLKVINKEGVSSENSATMERFYGNE